MRTEIVAFVASVVDILKTVALLKCYSPLLKGPKEMEKRSLHGLGRDSSCVVSRSN